MKKTLKGLVIGLFACVVLVVGGAIVFGGAIVKKAVNEFGPRVMGVPVTLEKAVFRPLAGEIRLTNLHVGNPEGFKTPALFDLGEVDVKLDIWSLLSDTIVIRSITVVSPHITYERSLRSSNFDALTKKLQRGAEKKPDKQPEEAKAREGGKKVVIDSLVVVDPALNVSVTAAGGHFVPVKLGRVELSGIGRDRGGVTFADAIKIIFSVITSNVENAVLGAGDAIGAGVKAVGGGVETVGGAVSDGASSIIKGVGGLFGGDKPKDGP